MTIPQSIIDKINNKWPIKDTDSCLSDIGIIILEGLRYAAKWGAFELDKWISVKDGLPEVLECVLWRLEDGKMIVDALSKDKSWPYWYAKPTHYQYLPKPPKDI